MPRPRRIESSQLSPGQASYVLDRLIRDRRVSAGDVSRYVSDMQREISELEQRLESLRQASGGSSSQRTAGAQPRRRGRPPASAQPAQSSAQSGAKGRRRRGGAITAEQRQSRVLQGRYLGLIRQIPASKRGQYQRIAKERGREAAIKEMSSALGK